MSQTNTNTITGAGGFSGKGCSGRGDVCGNNSITKHLFEGKMKDGCLSNFTITDTKHGATQYKKIIDTLPVLCVDKNFRYIDDVLCIWTDLPEATFLTPYLDQAQWSNTYNVEIKTVDPHAEIYCS